MDNNLKNTNCHNIKNFNLNNFMKLNQYSGQFYAGIGSRDTPLDFLELMTKVGQYLAGLGFVLRSGGANGADSYFEKGCDLASGPKEIYLPWNGFNGNKSLLYPPSQTCIDIAKKYHPAWEKLSQGAQKLQARNANQILGLDLKTPSSFVICWTKNGAGQGGTGQAIRMANDYKIPVFDMGKYSFEICRIELWKFLKTFNFIKK